MPATTSEPLWPTTGGLNTGRLSGSRAISSCSTRLWWSTVRRRRTASNTTMAASTTDTVNAADDQPSTRPTETVSAATNAEWALGMPPVETRRCASRRRLRIE